MLSIANVRSPSAAASYFADDNYYARADADRSGQWVGEGAKSLGLSGGIAESGRKRTLSLRLAGLRA